MKHNLCIHKACGFTLVELMVVIVIISVFAGMVGMSLGSAQQRELMQHHDKLVDMLKLARLESVDRAQVLGLQVLDESAGAPASYRVVRLDLPQSQSSTDEVMYQNSVDAIELQKSKKPSWQPMEELRQISLVDGMRLNIRQLDNVTPITHDKFAQATQGMNTPKILWFGNGEATPARLELMMQDGRIGKSITVDGLGKISVGKESNL